MNCFMLTGIEQRKCFSSVDKKMGRNGSKGTGRRHDLHVAELIDKCSRKGIFGRLNILLRPKKKSLICAYQCVRRVG